MTLEKNGKINGKINIIDLLTIILVVIAAVGITLRFVSGPAKNVKRKVNFVYTVQIDGVRDYSVKALQKKGSVYDLKDNYVGEIVDVKYENQIKEQFTEDGKVVFPEVPDKYTVYVTISSDGKETDDGYFVGRSTPLSVESWIDVATRYAHSSGKVISIEKNK